MAHALSTKRCIHTSVGSSKRNAAILSRPAHSNKRVVVPDGRARRAVLARAAEESQDFDALLIKIADKFEKAENKPIIVAYGVGAIFAFFTAEWLLHLPLLEWLLGFPVQLLGLLALPYLGIRYLLDGNDASKDVDAYTSSIISKLPGLEKK